MSFLSGFPENRVRCLSSVRILSVSIPTAVRILSGFLKKCCPVSVFPIGQERDIAVRTFDILVRRRLYLGWRQNFYPQRQAHLSNSIVLCHSQRCSFRKFQIWTTTSSLKGFLYVQVLSLQPVFCSLLISGNKYELIRHHSGIYLIQKVTEQESVSKGSSDVQRLVEDQKRLKYQLKVTRLTNQRLRQTVLELESKIQVWHIALWNQKK